jgi:uncharacterized protein DUF1461
MRSVRRRRAVVAAVAVIVPVVVLGNAVHVLAHGWFLRVEYARLQPEPYGLTATQRMALARTALDSIIPFGGGPAELRKAQLPSGRHAFGVREQRHLRDVRLYVLRLSVLHAIGIAVLAALAFIRRRRSALRAGLGAGALLTLGIAAFVGAFVAISPVGFLGGFHRVFFSGDSWRFAETDTLRRLFPDGFWSDTAMALGALVAAQAVALLCGTRYLRKQAIRRTPRTAAHAGQRP